MNVLDFQKDIERTMDRDWNDPELIKRIIANGPLLNFALGVGGEGGEIEDHVKKHIFHGHPLNRTHLLKECGDVMWYSGATAITLGSSVEEVLTMNREKLFKRFPNGFSEHASLNRKD